ncbi:hypothetical protein [Pseudorhodoferax sp. Leaf274]|uniref:head-tail joining protein n=1 Tax=Pseudorhodoferax sp. Leaf274 TaxID=1736318 RepID=UPI000703AF4C|nr:hypothetical protein [Pseudorhodoferax sp. Leaf274]KQP39675.1 hypothetical protein ASF44_08055 [Pseudorhodoferax sp. Leaf274]
MFTEDLGAFFDVASGFAVVATAGGASFPVIYDAHPEAVGGFVETVGPECRARSSDVAALDHGSQISVQGEGLFAVTGKQPDGTGITVLQLRRA